QERLAKLAGGVSVIKVGAATEVELKERKGRIEDAVASTRAALEEGIVAGGGTALINAAAALNDAPELQNLSSDQLAGVNVVRRAIVHPARWIALNAGKVGGVVVYSVAELQANDHYNVSYGEYGNLVDAGIIDPVKVTRSALAHAASIADMVLTTETLVADKVEEED